MISGGVAPNVVPPHAEAEDHLPHGRRSRGAARLTRGPSVSGRVDVEEVSKCRRCGSAREPGFDTAVFAYTTDIPFLDRWGTPLLFGPGSIHVAHTDREHVSDLIAELDRAVELNATLRRHARCIAEHGCELAESRPAPVGRALLDCGRSSRVIRGL